jgi:CotH kinase protein
MTRQRTAFVLFVALMAGVTTLGAQVRRQLLGVNPYPNADAFFDDRVLQDVRLVINTKDWQTLKDHYLENTYYPADFQWREVTVRNIGIRSRGTGSRSPVKPHLGVSFDRYVTDQKFAGLKSVVLRNNTQDPSNMHERLSMLLFRRMGLPISREAHMRLWINNEYAGLYTIVESIDEAFLKRALGENDGYLYSSNYLTDTPPYHLEYRGSDPGLYFPVPFKAENHSSAPKPEFIEQLIWTINETSDAVFRTAIAEYLDLTTFIRHVAVEMFVTDNDGLIGDYGINNFYLYRFNNQKRFMFVGWDKSEAFKGGFDAGIFRNMTDVPPSEQNRLMTRILSYRDLYDLYLDSLLECARSAGEPENGTANGPGWLEREIQREYGQIREAALTDPVKPYTNDEFEQAVSDLGVFARHRGDHVTREVGHARAQRPTSAGRR